MRRLSTRGRGELARSLGMSRPPAVITPSIGRTCGRPSCSSAPVCRIGAGGRGRRHGRTQISATACATTVRLRIRARNCKLRPDPEAQHQPAARWLTPCSSVLRPLREPFRSHPVCTSSAKRCCVRSVCHRVLAQHAPPGLDKRCVFLFSVCVFLFSVVLR